MVSPEFLKDEYISTTLTPGAEADYEWYYDLALYYTSDHKLWVALSDKWKVNAGQVTDYAKVAAREFCYEAGSPRQRWLSRAISASALPDVVPTSDPQLWTDYLGDMPYGDFTTTGTPAATEQMRYLAGAGIHGQQTISGGTPQAPVFLHGDLTGSTMLTTDAAGAAVARVTYTSFGEPVTAGGVGVPPASCGTRYQYDGGYGYESGLLAVAGPNTNLGPITLQHVGARWYQPGIGRFVQRDPIGIEGGMNCYLYCEGEPVTSVDPLGTNIDHGGGDLGYGPYGKRPDGPGGGDGGYQSPPWVPVGTAAGKIITHRVPKKVALEGAKSTTRWWANAVTKTCGRRMGLTARIGAKWFGPWSMLWDVLWIQGDCVMPGPLPPPDSDE